MYLGSSTGSRSSGLGLRRGDGSVSLPALNRTTYGAMSTSRTGATSPESPGSPALLSTPPFGGAPALPSLRRHPARTATEWNRTTSQSLPAGILERKMPFFKQTVLSVSKGTSRTTEDYIQKSTDTSPAATRLMRATAPGPWRGGLGLGGAGAGSEGLDEVNEVPEGRLARPRMTVITLPHRGGMHAKPLTIIDRRIHAQNALTGDRHYVTKLMEETRHRFGGSEHIEAQLEERRWNSAFTPVPKPWELLPSCLTCGDFASLAGRPISPFGKIWSAQPPSPSSTARPGEERRESQDPETPSSVLASTNRELLAAASGSFTTEQMRDLVRVCYLFHALAKEPNAPLSVQALRTQDIGNSRESPTSATGAPTRPLPHVLGRACFCRLVCVLEGFSMSQGGEAQTRLQRAVELFDALAETITTKGTSIGPESGSSLTGFLLAPDEEEGDDPWGVGYRCPPASAYGLTVRELQLGKLFTHVVVDMAKELAETKNADGVKFEPASLVHKARHRLCAVLLPEAERHARERLHLIKRRSRGGRNSDAAESSNLVRPRSSAAKDTHVPKAPPTPPGSKRELEQSAAEALEADEQGPDAKSSQLVAEKAALEAPAAEKTGTTTRQGSKTEPPQGRKSSKQSRDPGDAGAVAGAGASAEEKKADKAVAEGPDGKAGPEAGGAPNLMTVTAGKGMGARAKALGTTPLALHAHACTVYKEEFLTSQLTEPEVLQFLSEFSTLFKILFDAYCDVPVTATQRHMTLTALIRFCDDFGLFPGVCSFKEIEWAYINAECTALLSDIVEVTNVQQQPLPKAHDSHTQNGGAHRKHKGDKHRDHSPGKHGHAGDTEGAQKFVPGDYILFHGKWLQSHLKWLTKDFSEMTATELTSAKLLLACRAWLEERHLSVGEVLAFLERQAVTNKGPGYVDAGQLETMIDFMKFEDPPQADDIPRLARLLTVYEGDTIGAIETTALHMAMIAVGKHSENSGESDKNVFLKPLAKMTRIESNANIFGREVWDVILKDRKMTPEQLFREFDEKNVGVLPAPELTLQAQLLLKMKPEKNPALTIKYPFELLTRSEKGQVTREEFCTLMRKVKDARDTKELNDQEKHPVLLSASAARAARWAERGGASPRIFGVGTFAECLLKLTFNHLSHRGTHEQKAMSSYCKAIWLLLFLHWQYESAKQRPMASIQSLKVSWQVELFKSEGLPLKQAEQRAGTVCFSTPGAGKGLSPWVLAPIRKLMRHYPTLFRNIPMREAQGGDSEEQACKADLVLRRMRASARNLHHTLENRLLTAAMADDTTEQTKDEQVRAASGEGA